MFIPCIFLHLVELLFSFPNERNVCTTDGEISANLLQRKVIIRP
jgi:hypothetical protein